MMMKSLSNRWLPLSLLGAGVFLLLSGCQSWQRDSYGLPDVSSIGLRQSNGHWTAVVPDCAALLQPQRDGTDASRGQIAFGCATYTNLANSLARPEDLAVPRAYPGMQGDTAALAILRYRENKAEPLRETESTAALGNN